MSCDINAGRLTSCKDAIGGLLTVYFVNYEEVVSWEEDVTPGSEEQITGYTPNPLYSKVSAWKYDLHLGNDLTQNINSSPENGTLYFEQLTNLTLKKMSAEDNVQIRLLSAGRPFLLIEDQMGNTWLAGRINGNDVTGGTAVTGSDFGDLNGYTLTFTGKERQLANFYSGDVNTDFNVDAAPTPV
jgi:hypothetical protein